MFNKLLFVTSIAFAGLGSGAAMGQTRTASANVGRQLFISPMGEPFRGAARTEQLRTWFDRTDVDRDGALSLAEMRGDAEKFFEQLNRNQDREIDPTELRDYETRIAPEIQVGIASATPPQPGANENPNASKAKRESVRRGAGVYGLLATPNPVASADSNFNRGVSPEEFARAARDRFVMLDTNRDGRITFAELPPLPNRPTRGWSEKEANPTFVAPRGNEGQRY